MRLWPSNWWPRTLGAQLVVVTAAAVLLSNVAVATWFQLVQQQATESAINERIIDRALSAATLLSAIPARQREAAADALTSNIWHFQVHHGDVVHPAMDDDELAMAARVRAQVPKTRDREKVFVDLRDPYSDEALQNGTRPVSVVDITVPVVRGTELTTTFYRPPTAPWPLQVMIAAVVAILTTSLAAAFIASRVARPLYKLAASATQAARGAQAELVPEEGPDDVRRAAHAFNVMTDQVARTLARQRQLLSAVGHDLRTPITAMRISAEFIEDAEVRERLQKNLEELQDLTDAVLSAARGAGWEAMRKVDLSALIESVCADLEDMGLPVTWTAHEPAPLMCRPSEIRRATRNLIENAVAYGGKAEAKLVVTPEMYEIIVEDEGPGIAEEDRVRMFEPFVRLETSRSSETGGSGLGLTLVKAIAEGHGGTITLENRPDGGLRARLCLPRVALGA
ncbi:MAG TPA: ATP-binding protein [Rhizomicrobium sp.]|nr:ATP-binding protein [Rhizomicrobium sp.]